MIREAIKERLKELKISQRNCAIQNGLHYQNFHDFLKNRRSLPLSDIEKTLAYLDLKIAKTE